MTLHDELNRRLDDLRSGKRIDEERAIADFVEIHERQTGVTPGRGFVEAKVRSVLSAEET